MSQAATARSPRVIQPKEASLRELGVYELPDRREFVVSTLYADGCCLYSLGAWNTFGVAEYWLGVGGRLIRHGRLTQWRIGDLHDTGRTATYPKHRIL